jgi:hypothetical protein
MNSRATTGVFTPLPLHELQLTIPSCRRRIKFLEPYWKPWWAHLWERYSDRYDGEDACTDDAHDTQLALVCSIAAGGRLASLRQRGLHLHLPLQRLLTHLASEPVPRVDYKAGVYVRRWPDREAVLRTLGVLGEPPVEGTY